MRLRILTKEVLTSIPTLVEQGLNTDAIAVLLGCKKATLKVRCSQEKISLRGPGARCGRGRGRAIAVRLSGTALDRFRKRAAAVGISEATLATDLLEVIAQDDLFDAVLDTAKDAA